MTIDIDIDMYILVRLRSTVPYACQLPAFCLWVFTDLKHTFFKIVLVKSLLGRRRVLTWLLHVN